jgi:hypothetical protein
MEEQGEVMLISILVLSVTVIVLGYGFYLRNDDMKKYKAAIEEHRVVKNAPYSVPNVDIDIVDRRLWEVLD